MKEMQNFLPQTVGEEVREFVESNTIVIDIPQRVKLLPVDKVYQAILLAQKSFLCKDFCSN